MKEDATPFKAVLGNKLQNLGDNPFAMCIVEPFTQATVDEVNGIETEVVKDTYDISNKVHVIEGSIYYDNVNGMELIVYAGTDDVQAAVADDTVRIGAYAFAGSDVVRVKMPYTATAIGHKAFYACDKLEIVIFGSYTAPIFEEEFDPTYYESFEHIPGTGDYGTYTDYNCNEVAINGMGMLPYYMWNATGSMYSNVFYGANFVDYIGYVENKLIMVSPVNGVGYDSYIADQYFDYRIEGPAAPDDTTVAAIKAIKLIPERVSYDDKALVEAAREAYGKIATIEQQALVTNYADLVSAEQRITALAPVADAPVEADTSNLGNIITVIFVVILLGGLGFAFFKNFDIVRK